jgi:hypothetical protein
MVAFLVAALALHLSPLAMYRNIYAVVIPPEVGKREWQYLEPQLRPIDKERDVGKRIERYDTVLKWIDEDPNRAMRDLLMSVRHYVRLDKMREYVERRKEIEKAVLGKEPLGSHQCKQPVGVQEEQQFSRATSFGLATTGSLSFWVTFGLLGAWHLQRGKEAANGNPTEHRSP